MSKKLLVVLGVTVVAVAGTVGYTYLKKKDSVKPSELPDDFDDDDFDDDDFFDDDDEETSVTEKESTEEIPSEETSVTEETGSKEEE